MRECVRSQMENFLLLQHRVVRLNPALDQVEKGFGVQYEFVCFRAGGNCRAGVVDLIPLAPAGVEVVGQGFCWFSDSELGSFKGSSMMSGNTGDSVSGTCDGHLAGLQRSVICSGKAAIF
jgi:hypothetical protein